MRIAKTSRVVFAATMIVLGVAGLIQGDYAGIWQPMPKGVLARAILTYLCVFISLACGIGLFWKRTAIAAARVLFAWLLFWFLVMRVPVILHAPILQDTWSGCGETAVMVAAAWILYICLVRNSRRRPLAVVSGDAALRVARALYGLALIPFGVAHFVYVKETAALVPAWLPWHLTWAYLTGSAFLAAGVAVLIGVYARLAAALSALQLALFTLLVWFPIVAAGTKDAFQWSETIISIALTAGAWVIADSYESVQWLAIKRNQQ